MKLTKNILLLPKNIIDVKSMLINSGRNESDARKTIETTGISSISYAFPKLFTEFIFDGLSQIFDKEKSFFTSEY